MKPPVSTRRAKCNPLALEQHHLTLRLFLAREKRGPEPGEPAADDDQVGLVLTRERLGGLRGVGLIEPERPRLRVGVGAADGVGVHGRSLRWTFPEGWQSGRMRRS
jgi:hypothetical protein